MTLPPASAIDAAMFGKFDVSSAFSIDPFGFWPDARSSIEGLGGSGPAVEHDVVFHTRYVSFDAGPMSVDMVFGKLAASRGKMLLHAMALRDDGTTPVKVQSTTVIDLVDLVAEGGRICLPVIVKQDHAYAFMARIVNNDTDARAAALTLQTDQRADGATFARKLAAAKQTLFGPRIDPSGLVVDEVATLEHPRSQMCTAAQFDEPNYDRWIALTHRVKHCHRKQWEYVWLWRSLEAMGCLIEGARGLGFGCGVEPMPALFASYGISVTATDLGADDRRASRWQDTSQHLLSLGALADPTICPPERFDSHVEVAAVDMNRIPATLSDYDFCWSSCSLEHLGTINAGLAFIEHSLDTLKPGGVAVHTTEFNLTSDSRTIKRGGTVLFRRRDIEGFARRMRAAGHDVVPITWDQGDQPEDQIVDVPPYAADVHFKLALRSYVTTSFGLAIRKR